MRLSVVIPVMNERDNIEPLLSSIYKALDSKIEYELILVDDGSSDDTVEQIGRLAKAETRVLVFNRNYGQTTAMAAGIESACGELIVTLDGDLQNDPIDILPMIEKLESEGWDVVAGRRVKRQDGTLLRKIPSKIANYIIRRSTGVYISDYGCTLKVFTKDVAKNLELYGELHRFIPVLAKIYGAKITEMDVKHHARSHGVSKYGIGRTTRVISDLMLMLFMQKYRVKPMHLFGTLGLLTFIPGVLINFYLLILKMLGNDIGHRPLLTLGIVLLLAGIQLITTGFLAELIMRTYFESQNKKPYSIKETIFGTKNDK
jgi:glycosyltransferase involved in cell wall biosynthesis